MSNKKFMVYAKHSDSFNNMEIECASIEDMDIYAKACKVQGYEPVYTKAKPHYEGSLPLCARCKLPLYIPKPMCVFCGQIIEWGD